MRRLFLDITRVYSRKEEELLNNRPHSCQLGEFKIREIFIFSIIYIIIIMLLFVAILLIAINDAIILLVLI